jgi:hypothetical protein
LAPSLAPERRDEPDLRDLVGALAGAAAASLALGLVRVLACRAAAGAVAAAAFVEVVRVVALAGAVARLAGAAARPRLVDAFEPEAFGVEVLPLDAAGGFLDFWLDLPEAFLAT